MDNAERIKSSIDCRDVLKHHRINIGNGKKNIRCPFPDHEDKNPSFGIYDDGARFKCHGCGRGGDCIQLEMELSGKDFQPCLEVLSEVANVSLDNGNARKPRKPLKAIGAPPKPKPTKDTKPTYKTLETIEKSLQRHYKSVSKWIYHDTDGKQVFAALRCNPIDGKKDFRLASRVKGGWQFGKPDGELPPYNLPQLLNSKEPIYIAEGEKCADALAGIGLTATTSAQGSRSAGNTNWTSLHGREVFILPDNDTPGVEYGQAVAQLATDAGAASVKVVGLPDLPPKGDVVDFLEVRDAHESADVKDTVEIMAKSAPEWTAPESEPEPSATNKGKGSKPRSALISFSDWANKAPEPHDPVFEGLVDMARFSVLIGKAKMKKSFFALQAGLSIASGRDFLAWKTHKKRRVLLVQFEVHERDLHERVVNMAAGMDIDPGEVGDRLRIWNAKATRIDSGGVNAIEKIKTVVEGVSAEVVIVDPLFRIQSDGDEGIENLRPLVLEFDRMATQTGAMVLVIHHDTKGSAGDRDHFDRGSGSNVLGRSAYFQATLTPHENGDPDYVCVETGGNGYPQSDPITTQWSDNRFVHRDDIYAQKQTSATRVKSRVPKTVELSKFALQIVGDEVIPLGEYKAQMKQKVGLSKDRELDSRSVLENEGVICVTGRSHEHGGRKYVGTPAAIAKWESTGDE